MCLISTFIIAGFVTAIRANITTYYLSELCPRTPGGEANLSLSAVTEPFYSTAVIMADPRDASKQWIGYDYNTNCKLKVSGPPGYHIIASVEETELRDRCADKLTIYADDQKRMFCGTRSGQTDIITAQSVMVIEFISGSYLLGEIPFSTGFELAVTAYRDGPCHTNTEFGCENGRCIGAELNCSKYNLCGDNSNQQCDIVTEKPNSCGAYRFTCENGNCINNRYICDGINDCGDNSDENICGNCSHAEFACKKGMCVNSRYVCDKANDCDDWSDEDNCTYTCLSSEFSCRNGHCVRSQKVCNKKDDCGDRSDEEGCTYTCLPYQFTCKNGSCIPSFEVCDKINDCGDWSDEADCTYTCSPWYFLCKNGKCIYDGSVCDRQNDCGDWSDEENCTYTCAPYQFTCKNGSCVSSWKVCDRENDCGDWSDEEGCTYTCPSWQDTCNNGNCFSYYQHCDGTDDCGDGTDEENCSLSVSEILGIIIACGLSVAIISITIAYCKKKRNVPHLQPTSIALQ